LVTDFQSLETREEQVVYVDLNPAQDVNEIQSDGETVEQSSWPVEQSNGQTGTRFTGLSASQLATAANLSQAQNTQAYMLAETALTSSNSTVLLSDNHSIPLLDTALGSIEVRGPPTEIVFIESFLEPYFQLKNAHSGHVVLNVLPADTRGVDHISHSLSTYQGISAIHIVSHGAPGHISIGTDLLDSASLDRYADDLSAWGNALAAEGDLFFYGCAVAQGDAGQDFINRIADLTRAHVAASTDNTGAQDLGGDWALEYQTGPLETGLPLATDGYASILAPGGISGHVSQHGTGENVPGIQIHVYQGHDPDHADQGAWNYVTSVWTDASGNYTVSGLPQRRYRLHVNDGVQSTAGEHFISADLYEVQVFDDATTTNMDLTLRRAGSIWGYVYDEANQPITNAQVVMAGSYTDDWDHYWHDTWVNNAGRYDLYLPPTDMALYPLQVN